MKIKEDREVGKCHGNALDTRKNTHMWIRADLTNVAHEEIDFCLNNKAVLQERANAGQRETEKCGIRNEPRGSVPQLWEVYFVTKAVKGTE